LEYTLVEVEDADYELIQNLIRFYIYDMSEFTGWACPSNGLFGGVDDQAYYFGKRPDLKEALWPDGWTGKGYKVLVDNEIIGFCLVRLFTQDTYQLNDIGEFFILRKFRNKGLGKQVAHAIFDRFPGNWQVRQMVANRPAQAFWRKTISAYTQDQFNDGLKFVDGYGEMVVQEFTSPDSRAGTNMK